MENKIDNLEYDKLIKRLEFFDTMRNNLLTFSFTAVLTVLGIALQMEMDSVSSWICLIPYFLIIPFSARISYYRVASAHINSFLRVFANERMQFEIGTKTVKEKNSVRFGMIAWLVNHEMVLLGTACSCLFYFKYIPNIKTWALWEHISIFISALLILFVFIITDSSYNYERMITDYSEGWEKYRKQN